MLSKPYPSLDPSIYSSNFSSTRTVHIYRSTYIIQYTTIGVRLGLKCLVLHVVIHIYVHRVGGL